MKKFSKKDAQLIAAIFDNEGLEYTLIDGGQADSLLGKVPEVWRAVVQFKEAHDNLMELLVEAGVEEL